MSTTSPNMGLIVPVPNVTPGPDYATDIQSSLNTIDSHDHSSGKGVPVGVSGINIQGDLSLNGNRLTQAKSVILSNQTSSLASTDARGVYCLNGDLFFVNGTTNVQLTSGTSIAGATGNITGLVNPAAVVFNSTQFEFYQNQGTGVTADIYAADYTIYKSGTATTVKLTHAAGSSYVYTLPAGVAANNNSPLVMNTSGVTSASAAITIASGGVIPTANATTDLGSSGNRFKGLFIGTGDFSGAVSVGSTLSVSGALTVGSISVSTSNAVALTAITTSPTAYINFQNNGASASVTGNSYFQFVNENGLTSSFVGSTLQTDGGSDLEFVTTPAGSRSSYRGVERVRITADGNVGIGTTSPAYKLDVNGAIRAQSGVVTDNVVIKHKKLTGTTDASGVLTVAHGLTSSKILNAIGFINEGSGTLTSIFANGGLGISTTVFWNATNVVFGITGLPAIYGSKSASILVTYEA